jgi:hypothetical protein
MLDNQFFGDDNFRWLMQTKIPYYHEIQKRVSHFFFADFRFAVIFGHHLFLPSGTALIDWW